MKKIAFLLAIITCFVVSVHAQPSERVSDRVLNSSQLRNEIWYYSMEDAMKAPEKVYKLSLTGQKMKVLPEDIAKLKNLQMLSLSECGLKILPANIGELKNLQMISLYGNRLRSLPYEIRELNHLEVLYLGRNHLTEIPVWIGGMGRLRRLDVSGNLISPQELIFIRRMMPRVDVTY